MIRLSELQNLEIVAIENGRRLGNVFDLEIDADTGKIHSLIIMQREGSGLFKKVEESVIKWDHIVTVGTDVILVRTAD